MVRDRRISFLRGGGEVCGHFGKKHPGPQIKKTGGWSLYDFVLKLLVVISIELRRLESEKISNWQIGSCVSSIILGQWREGMGLLELYVPFLFLGGGEEGGIVTFPLQV